MKPGQFPAVIAAILIFAATALAAPEFTGIGVALGIHASTKSPQIMKVLPNSPAAKAMVPEGAVITKIDGVLTAGKTIEECVTLIRGRSGSTVQIEIMNPKDNETLRLELKRETFDPEKASD